MPERDQSGQDEPEQLRRVRLSADLSIERTRRSLGQTIQSIEQTNESIERNALASEGGPNEPEQIALMRRLVDLSLERTRQSIERTNQSIERTLQSIERTNQSVHRTDQSAVRSEMSAERSYMNAERTLSVWIRTALAAMVVGIAIDRFRIFLLEEPLKGSKPDAASSWAGVGLVALGVVMAAVTAARFWLYAAAYRRTHKLPAYHGAFMAPAFAVLVAIFGIVLLILLIIE